jgi:hypothetical protein
MRNRRGAMRLFDATYEPINVRCDEQLKGDRTGEDSKVDEDRRDNAQSFSAAQIDAMNQAFRQTCAKLGLTGSTPVIELVAVRIVELANSGELDPDKLTDIVSTEFAIP